MESGKKRRKFAWDDMGAQPPGAQPPAAQPAPFVPPDTSTREQRTIYCGNLPPGMVNGHMVSALFTQICAAFEGFDPFHGPAVMSVKLCGGGTYALVEFRDAALGETMMQFNGMELSGRQLKINRPNGYAPPDVSPQTLRVPPELRQRFRIPTIAGPPPQAQVQAPLASAYTAERAEFQAAVGIVAERAERSERALALPDRKARELFVGNLAVGIVTKDILTALFTEPLLTLPAYQAQGSPPPVVSVKVDDNGKFAFVEFRDEETAVLALSLFNKMELLGRPMHIQRPQSYVGSASAMLQGAAGASTAALLGVTGGATHSPAAAPATASGTSAAAPMARVPTRTLCLRNLLSAEVMADPAEYAECVEDIRAEAASYGAIRAFLVPREGALAGRPAGDLGKCFVQYEDVASAIKARDAMRGREFDGSVVSAELISDDLP